MYNLSLTQDQNISAQQLREQIKAQVKAATTEARQAVQEARAAQAAGGRTILIQPGVPGPPVTLPGVAERNMPFPDDMPPRVKDVSIAFFVVFAAIIIAWPLMRAIGKRIERGAPAPVAIPAEMQSQMQHLMQSVDAIAIEVERISEGQRFTTKMLSDRKPDV